MKTNLRGFDRAARVGLALIAAWLAFYAFTNPVMQVIAGGVALYALFEAGTGACPLFMHLGVRSPKDSLKDDGLYLVAILGIQATLAYVWLSAGIEKLMGAFAANLATTFASFASKNPYPWMASFLTGYATEHASTFASLVIAGELGAGLTLGLGTLCLMVAKTREAKLGAALLCATGAGVGMLLNATFWLAAGWTGPGAAGLNAVMFWVSLSLVYVWKYRMWTMK